MIECHLAPFARLVTGAAVRPKLPVVHIPRGVTRETILRRAFEYVVHMAGFAGNRRMAPA